MATFSTKLADRVTQRTFQYVVEDRAINVSSRSFTIYSGSQPTAASVQNEWSAYASTNTNCLAHFDSTPTWAWNATSSTYYFDNSSMSCSTSSIHSGTATWAIMWTTKVQTANMGLSGIPSTSFMVVPVTDTSGTGIFRFTSTTITQSTTIGPADGGFSVVWTT